MPLVKRGRGDHSGGSGELHEVCGRGGAGARWCWAAVAATSAWSRTWARRTRRTRRGTRRPRPCRTCAVSPLAPAPAAQRLPWPLRALPAAPAPPGVLRGDATAGGATQRAGGAAVELQQWRVVALRRPRPPSCRSFLVAPVEGMVEGGEGQGRGRESY